jgi:hypothetical protein
MLDSSPRIWATFSLSARFAHFSYMPTTSQACWLATTDHLLVSMKYRLLPARVAFLTPT